MSWQKFMGSYLQTNKFVIAIAGTHGKSTTTALAGSVLQAAGLDPIVVVGAVVPEWGKTVRIGKSKYFVCEADEFNDNFLNYAPSIAIINNIEMDHPEFFDSMSSVLESFANFVKGLTGKKVLIINQDSEGIKEMLTFVGKDYLKEINIFGYTLKENPKIKLKNSTYCKILSKEPESTTFETISTNQEIKNTFNLKVPGIFNVQSALGVLIMSRLLEIKDEVILDSLSKFNGIGRRLELIGEKRGIKVYDDYAHHPTAINATIGAIKQKHPESRLWVINEPHSFSRTKALLPDYKNAFNQADKVIIAPIFQARDSQNFGVSGQSIIDIIGKPNAIYLDSFEKIVNLVKSDALSGDVILVMGAGKSYELSRQILKAI